MNLKLDQIGQKTALNKYSWDNDVEKLINLLRDIEKQFENKIKILEP